MPIIFAFTRLVTEAMFIAVVAAGWCWLFRAIRQQLGLAAERVNIPCHWALR
jgi:hypothetical protein